MNSIHLHPAEPKHSLRKPSLKLKTQYDQSSLNESNTIIIESRESHQHNDPFLVLHERRAQLIKRETILLDLTNNDVLPALDYALSMLEAEPEPETSSANNYHHHHHHHLPSSLSHSPTSPSSSFSISSSPPRHVFAPPSWGARPSTPHVNSPAGYHTRHPTVATYPLDPQEFAHVFSPSRSSGNSSYLKSIPPSIPFPTASASPTPSARIPLLQRKPRLGQLTTETITLDMHDPFIFGNPSNLTLVRSISALDRRQECASYKSTTSLNTIESSWSTLSPRRPVLRSASRIFSSPKKFRLGALNRHGSIKASLKKPLLNIRRTLSHSDCNLADGCRC